MISRQRYALAFVLTLATLAISAPAAAVGLGTFGCITNNIAGDCAIGEAQLSATLVESGGDVLLTLTMTGSDAGVVEQLFIESSIVSGITFQSSTAAGIVVFGSGQSGGTLPGGNMVGFMEAFNISANNPKPRNGIGRHSQDDLSPQAGAFLLELTGGSFDDLLSDLRIGVHVISFDTDGSESFISVVPEPRTAMLLGLGLLMLCVVRRPAL